MGIVYNYIFNRNPGPLDHFSKRSHTEEYYKWRDDAAEILKRRERKVFHLTSPRGVKLKGYYYPASDTPSNTIAVIVHGYRSDHADTAGMFQKMYHSRGIDIFAIDQPAHGESEGDLISFGYFEGEALLCWLQMLEIYFGVNTSFLLHGFSMGGGTVCLISDRIPESVKFIIDDCGISGAASLLRSQLGILYTPFNIINMVRNKLLYSLNMTDPKPHLARAKCPILFIHGKEDKLVPYSAGRENYLACSSYKEFLTVEGAAHMECYYVAPEEYEKRLDSFLKFFS